MISKNIENSKDAIDSLCEIAYYEYDYETEENKFAKIIEECILKLESILPDVERYEREIYNEQNNISCKTCKHENSVGEWVCDMCLTCCNWERK